MPIPSTIADLSTTASSNSPQGSDSPTEGDNYIRALSAIIAQEHAALLASTAATFGAGRVGFSAALDYVANTIGWAVQRTGITPTMCGAVGDGVTDDTAALQAWANSEFTKVGEPKTFKVTGQITFAADTLKLDARGMVIDASAGGTFTDSSVVYCVGALTTMPDLSVSPALRARSLTFASAHGRSEGDVFIIFNPTANSWAANFTYAYAGEFCRVQYVTSSTVVKTENGLHAAYTAANVDVYAMTKNEVQVSNLTVIAPNSGNIRPIEVSLATRVRLRNVHGKGSNYVGISTDRCYDVEGSGCTTDVNVQVTASKYGWSFANCHSFRLIGCELNAVRHAVNIGGDDKTGSVPCRIGRIIGSVLRSDSAFTGVPCCDIHSNAQDIVYESNDIYGGGGFGGKDCSYIGNTFHECDTTTSAMLAGGSGWLGGTIKVIGNTFKASGAYPNGIVRGFTDATNTVADTHLIVRDNIVSMSTCDTFVRMDHNHLTHKANMHVSGVTFLDSASLTNICRGSGPGSAVAADYVVVEDITNGKSGASLYVEVSSFAATLVRLMRQAGTVAITPVSAQPNAASTVTPRYSYGSRTPCVQLTPASGTVNSQAITAYTSSVSAASFGANIRVADDANMGVTTPDVNVFWATEVAEI